MVRQLAVPYAFQQMLEPGTHRPRNVGWARAAALLYGDWGTSKAYVIGLAFVAAGFSSFPIILAVCAYILTALLRARRRRGRLVHPWDQQIDRDLERMRERRSHGASRTADATRGVERREGADDDEKGIV